ncbi:MAG TPA: tetratricopeptide repeat protein, partial [Candidatus Baltobacteraceae bacterium]|nr:tetratricopeptide repeat protein [Candidatus Baltobacteraceae bacterium]
MLAPVAQVPILPRIGYAAVSYFVYLQKMFYPTDLAVIYPFPQNGLPLPEIILALVLLAGISTAVLALRRRHPYLMVGWFWYLGVLVPMIGIIHTGSVARADRFTYLAQIGAYIMLAWAVKDLTASWRHGRRMLGAGAFSVIAALMLCAWKQSSYWRNSQTLWTHTLACTKDNAFAYNDFGGALLANGQIDDAIENFQKALQINPNYAEVYHNLGDAFIQKGNRGEAIAQYQKALTIDSRDERSHVNLGIVLYQSGQINEAVDHYQKALEIDPTDTKTHNNFGLALAQLGRMDEAIAQYEDALTVDPQNLEAHFNLGNAFVQAGQFAKAIEHYKKALELNPDDAEVYNNLGLAFYQSGNKSEATASAQKALQLA